MIRSQPTTITLTRAEVGNLFLPRRAQPARSLRGQLADIRQRPDQPFRHSTSTLRERLMPCASDSGQNDLSREPDGYNCPVSCPDSAHLGSDTGYPCLDSNHSTKHIESAASPSLASSSTVSRPQSPQESIDEPSLLRQASWNVQQNTRTTSGSTSVTPRGHRMASEIKGLRPHLPPPFSTQSRTTSGVTGHDAEVKTGLVSV